MGRNPACRRGEEGVGRWSYQDMDKWFDSCSSAFSTIILHAISRLRLVLQEGKEGDGDAAEPLEEVGRSRTYLSL